MCEPHKDVEGLSRATKGPESKNCQKGLAPQVLGGGDSAQLLIQTDEQAADFSQELLLAFADGHAGQGFEA